MVRCYLLVCNSANRLTALAIPQKHVKVGIFTLLFSKISFLGFPSRSEFSVPQSRHDPEFDGPGFFGSGFPPQIFGSVFLSWSGFFGPSSRPIPNFSFPDYGPVSLFPDSRPVPAPLCLLPHSCPEFFVLARIPVPSRIFWFGIPARIFKS